MTPSPPTDKPSFAAQMKITRLRARDEAASGFSPETVTDAVANERAVAIEINGRVAAVVMALPGGEEELAAGFALGEGLIRTRQDLLLLRACEPEAPEHADLEQEQWPVRVKLVIPVALQPARPEPMIIRYACGASAISAFTLSTAEGSPLESIGAPPRAQPRGGAAGEGFSPPAAEPLPFGLTVKPAALREMLRGFSAAQTAFHATGCTHAAGLFAADGSLLLLREDIGRHNAVDRVLGRALLEEMDFSDKVLIVSGRASADLVFKAFSARVPILASLSAPTALAVNWARKGGLTLVGFLKPRRFNIYSGPERIAG